MIKKVIIFLLILLCLSCFQKNIIPTNITTTNKYEFYYNLFPKSINNGFAGVTTSLLYTKYVPLQNPDFDKLWFQGMYGIFLSLDCVYNTNILYVEEFISGIESMLKETEGVYLRDNTEKTIVDYKNGNTSLEASKDQMLGVICGMFMIYYYCPDKDIKSRIKNIIQPLYLDLVTHGYLLYNKKEKRFYNSAYYLISHYYGVSRALSYILDKKICTCDESLESIALTSILFEGLKYKKSIISKELFYKDINLFQLPYLTNKIWYQGMLKNDEFGVNLTFYELIIGSTISKEIAKKVINILEIEDVMKLKHLNLAALYFYCSKVWDLPLSKIEFYKQVLRRDIYLYPVSIPPNSFDYNSKWVTDTINLFIQRNFSLTFDASWDTPLNNSGKTLLDLENMSIIPDPNKRIDIDCGVPFLMRYLMVN